ncbi:hypothetical protein [Ornithinibacillus scapharcae]|uniref:hypothetical protein n=1 Tax=Ornithinibacillus scapharcae TaxID=1147159 RepID=UPI000225BCA8|nr:hypothetical protein [Ornithinibacillus scapharcae]
MKIVFFFGLMVMAFFISIYLARFLVRKTYKIQIALIIILIVNIIILGLGSLWWLVTETDGISQGIGIIMYGFAFVVINLISLFFLSVWNGKINE